MRLTRERLGELALGEFGRMSTGVRLIGDPFWLDVERRRLAGEEAGGLP